MNLNCLFRSVSASRIIPLMVALLIITASSSFSLAAIPPHVRQEQGAKISPPTRYIPSRDYDTRHIKLDLRFDWEREQAYGTATITFAPLTPNMRRLELDAANMTFAIVTLASGTPLQYEANPAQEKLDVTLDHAYQPSDEVTIVVTYRTKGTLSGTGILGFGQGLTFIKPTPDDPKRPRQIWSQGESEYNHTWFPCHDHPNDFATSEMVATIERPYTIISNGKLLDTRDNADNTRTFHWRMDQPHASYLTSIVVGEYVPIETSYDGIPLITYVYPSEVAEGRVTAARLANMVRFFSEKTGVRYPYPKYAQTMVRDFGGGMENISATTLTDQTVHDARTALDKTEDDLISHELAHQWFGDYVTCRTWADIWLNESFATYFEAMWAEKNLGRDDFLYSQIKDDQDSYFAAWARGQRRPVVTRNYTNVDDLFDVYAYPRGGATLHMLRSALGEENWWRSINHYLTKYAHQPVQTEQFRIAIEETTGQPMDWFFDEWIYKMGHPVFDVHQAYDDTVKTLTLTVRQEQKLDPTSPYPQTEFFRTPLDVAITTATGTRVERVIIEPKLEQTLSFKVEARPLIVNFDRGNTIIKELRFAKSVDELVYQLTRDEDVTGRVFALEELTRLAADSKVTDAERARIAETLAGVVTKDKFWGVRQDAAQALAGAPYASVRAALLAAATKDERSLVRAAAIRSLAVTKDATLADVYAGLLDDRSYAVVRAAAQALGATKDKTAYERLAKLVGSGSWRDQVRIAGLDALAALGDRRALDAGLRYAGRENALQVRAAALAVLGATGKGDARAFPLASESLLQGATTGSLPLVSAAASSLVELGDKRAVEVFKQAQAKATSDNLRTFLVNYEQRLQVSGGATP